MTLRINKNALIGIVAIIDFCLVLKDYYSYAYGTAGKKNNFTPYTVHGVRRLGGRGKKIIV
jgi:hypothetical protein